MHQRYFITSTGTGIGKTFITAGLVRQAKALSKSVAAYKPVISGFDPEKPEESDIGTLLRALDQPLTPENIARISPRRFQEPLAPSMAARMEKRTLDYNALLAQTLEAMKCHEDIILIEGIGGVMVPLDNKHIVLDWIEALEIEAILVTGSYLGTLSHTLTALEALQHRKIPVFAIIVNESEESPVPLQETVDELARFTRLPIVPVKRRASNNEDISELRGLLG